MDQIIMKGLRVRGRHGTTTQELTFGQEFEVDLQLDLDLHKACESDKEEDTISKIELIHLVTRIIDGEHCDLPEHLANRIVDAIMKNYPCVKRVEILLQQPQIPIAADFDYVGIRLIRP